MGIAVAIGSIAVFGSYSDDVENTAKEQESKIAKSKIQSALFKLKNVDSGRTQVDLPEKLGSSSYTVALDDRIQILTDDRTFSENFEALGTGYRMTGTAEGGTIDIYKSGNNFTLRGS